MSSCDEYDTGTASLGFDNSSNEQFKPGKSPLELAKYYGYSSFMAEKLKEIFSPDDFVAFLEANESPRLITIRANTLKTRRRELAQALINRGMTVNTSEGSWNNVCLQISESPVPIGATPEYLAGHYIIQSASSLIPVLALCPQPEERILDMAAAPGGKATHIASMMNNRGCIFANDPSLDRCKALSANIHRLGAKNVMVCSYDGRELINVMNGFDRVLLDTPCSGTGVICKDPSVKTSKTAEDFVKLTHLQKELILAAIDVTRHNNNWSKLIKSDSTQNNASESGVIVYSTCSVTVEENEEIISYALSKRPNVKLVDIDLPFGQKGFTSFRGRSFHPSLGKTKRFYTHKDNMDGFFVAKLVKISPSPTSKK